MSTPILFAGSDGDSTRIVYNHLSKLFGEIPAIIEEPQSRKAMLRVRIHKLGLMMVASQLVFMVLVRPIIAFKSKSRIQEIKAQYALDCTPIPDQLSSLVSSINSSDSRQIISELNPKIIIVNGTRIISKKVLENTEAIFINTHAGITPKYRGSHGGYWALYNGDGEHCGTTVHLIDSGIDTGDIIAQATIQPDSQDTFVTYPYLQTAAALPLLGEAVRKALEGKLETRKATGPSAVWYHPGFIQYFTGLFRGVR